MFDIKVVAVAVAHQELMPVADVVGGLDVDDVGVGKRFILSDTVGEFAIVISSLRVLVCALPEGVDETPDRSRASGVDDQFGLRLSWLRDGYGERVRGCLLYTSDAADE